MSKPTNVLLITIDSLRADHLSCMGFPHPTTPCMDKLASEGVLCERLFCSAIPTHPSYTTLYTGQHAVTHQIVAHGGKNKLDSKAPFLPQIFLRQGHTTCAVDNMWRGRPWFGRGYEFYVDPSVRKTLLLAVTCEDMNHRAIPWLQSHAEEPFFMFLHYWDPHYPYTPPKRHRHLFYDGQNPTDPNNRSLDPFWKQPIGAAAKNTWLRSAEGTITDIEYVRALYAQEVRHIDEGIGELIRSLDELGIAENTLVVLLADHGESLGEHGIYFDHYGLYDGILHVPLILRMPGKLPAGKRVSSVFQMHDVAPTLLEAAGLPPAPKMDGRSFWKALVGDEHSWHSDPVISLECTWQAKWSLRTDTHKLIVSRRPDSLGNPEMELYDLREDPAEERNVAEEKPDLAGEMRDRLETWIAERLAETKQAEDPVVVHGPSLRDNWQGVLG